MKGDFFESTNRNRGRCKTIGVVSETWEEGTAAWGSKKTRVKVRLKENSVQTSVVRVRCAWSYLSNIPILKRRRSVVSVAKGKTWVRT